jgi:transcriptional regulator with XRE-family HTH domain
MKMMYLKMSNPIVEARHMAGLSLDRLGRKLSLSKQYLSRAEQATYSGINPALTTWVADILDQPKGRVMNDYFAYQAATRKQTKNNVNPILLARAGSKLPGHVVFSNWRAMYWISPTAFSNAMCVHPESVRNYEEGMISSMPDQLKKALRSVGMIDPNWTEIPPGA